MCAISFSRWSNLYMYEQSIHNGIREISKSSKTYRNSFALKRYLNHLHSDCRFSCYLCERKLATKESLESTICNLTAKCTIVGRASYTKYTKIFNDTLRIHTMTLWLSNLWQIVRSKSTCKQHLLDVRPDMRCVRSKFRAKVKDWSISIGRILGYLRFPR